MSEQSDPLPTDRDPISVNRRLLVRMAAMPWETTTGFRSPGLAQVLDRTIALEADVRAATEGAATALEELIGSARDPERRRSLVALRRAFGRRTAVRRAEVARLLPADRDVRARCEAALALSDDLEVRRESAARMATDAIGRERDHLLTVVARPAFERAVAIAQPEIVDQLRSHLRRFSNKPAADQPAKARHLRFESTLVNLVLRAAGRPTPNAAWCGVFVADTVDTVDVDVADDVRGPRAQERWDIWASPQQERIAVQVDLSALAEVLRSQAGDDLAVAHEDCWSWMTEAAAGLADPCRTAWERATAELRQRCDAMGDQLEATNAADWLALHRDVTRIVDGLRAGAGLESVARRSSVRVDWRLPLAGIAPPSARTAIARSIDEWLVTQAAWGFGALWSEATADSLSAEPMAPSGTHGDADRPTVEHLVSRVGTAEHVSRAIELTERFERAVGNSAGGWESDVVTFDDHVVDRAPGVRMGPWGSGLLTTTPSGFTVRSVRGEPALFQARLAAIVPEVIDDIIESMRATGQRAVSCRCRRYVNPSAALGATLAPRLTAPAVELRRVDRHHVGIVDPDADGDGGVVVPILDHAAAPLPEGDGERLVLRAASTWGWELIASGLPLLPAELGPGGHLPALAGPRGITVHPERWLLAEEELRPIASESTPFDRFTAWRRLILRRKMPDVLSVRLQPSPNAEHRLVLGDSLLSVNALARDLPNVSGVAVAMAGPSLESLLPGPGGAAHAAEVAVTFLDHGFTRPA